MTPSTSVQSAYQPPLRRTRVLALPTMRARSLTSLACARAANFPGIVTEYPIRWAGEESTRDGRRSASQSMRS